MAKSVLLVGLEPTLVDFSDPDLPPGLDAGKVQAAIDADKTRLAKLGYDADLCLTDLGATAEAAAVEQLKRRRYDAVVIGAGVRKPDRHFLLFERLVNAAHEHAPQAKLCFNTKPDDTAEAVGRWI